MPDTLIEKALAKASSTPAVRPGDIVVAQVDVGVLIDLQFVPEHASPMWLRWPTPTGSRS